MTVPPFLLGPRLALRGISHMDVGPEWLAWLNDPEVLRYRAPKAFPYGEAALRAYIDGIPARGDLMLAITERAGGRHVGNVAVDAISWVHGSANLSIMIGARDVWGRGYSVETIRLVADHVFGSMGLHRLMAQSPNPAFNAAMRKLGWTHEGDRREAFLVDGAHVDIACWGLLKREWLAARAGAAAS